MQLTRSRRYGGRPDDGVSIVIAVMVSLIAMSLSLIVASVVLRVDRDSGVGRQRAVAIGAAEAGIDAATAAIVAGGAPPCSWATDAGGVRSYPDTTTTSASIAYFDGTTALPCPAGGSLTSGIATRAVITSRATTQTLTGGGTRGARSMTADVALTASGGPYLSRAIFSDAALSIGSSVKVDAPPGVKPDIYSNSDVTCGQSMQLSGSIYAQGGITLGSSCTLGGDVYAKGGVSGAGPTSLGGNVTSSQGSVTLSSSSVVAGKVSARGTVSWSGCTSATCSSNQALSDPPAEGLPVLSWDAAAQAAWQSAGYTIVTKEDCTANAVDNPRRWAVTNGPVLQSKTVLVTHCPLDWGSVTSLQLAKDLAVVSFRGITNSSVMQISSTGGSRSAYWIVPFDAVTSRPCTSVPMSTGSSFSVSSDVSMLFYSPCDITLNVSGNVYGQVYSGSSVKQTQSLYLHYRASPLWGRAGGPPLTYTAMINRRYESS